MAARRAGSYDQKTSIKVALVVSSSTISSKEEAIHQLPCRQLIGGFGVFNHRGTVAHARKLMRLVDPREEHANGGYRDMVLWVETAGGR